MGLVACLLACGLVWAGTATNGGTNAVPITVDGFTDDGGGTSGGEYSTLQSLRYVSGSLYRGDNNDPRLNSRIYAVVAKDGAEPKSSPYALFVRFDFLRRTVPFADGETIGMIHFQMSTNGGLSRRDVTVTLRGASNTGRCDGILHFDDGFTPDTPLATYGMKAAVGFAPGDLSSTTPYLHVELKAPSLLIPKNFGAPFPNRGYPDGYYQPALTRWTANFATDTADPLDNPNETQQSEANIQIVPGATQADNDGLDIRAEVDLKPGNADNVIGSADSGVLVVAVISQAQLGADAVDANSVTLGDAGLPGVLRPSKAQQKDVNNDGVLDWVFNFDLTPGHDAISSESTVLVLKGLTKTGAPFSGKDHVTVVR